MTIYGIVIYAAVVGGCGFLFVRRLTDRSAAGLAVAVVLVAGGFAIDVGAQPAIGFLYGAFGEFSVTLAALLLGSVYLAMADAERLSALRSQLTHLKFVAAAAGLLLYPMSLGLGYFDPYALGYRPALLLAAVVAGTVLWWIERARAIALCLTAAALSHTFDLGESSNLWDYLIDPVVVIYCLAFSVRKTVSMVIRNG